MAVVAVSWLAIEIAPAAERGMWVALAAAAYTLSGAVGALLLGRLLRHRPRPDWLPATPCCAPPPWARSPCVTPSEH